MSAAAVAVQHFAGWSKTPRGGEWSHEELVYRVGSEAAHIFMFVRTRETRYGVRGSVPLSLGYIAFLLHKTERAVRDWVHLLVEHGLLSRDPDDPWRFRHHPERVMSTPVLVEAVVAPGRGPRKPAGNAVEIHDGNGLPQGEAYLEETTTLETAENSYGEDTLRDAGSDDPAVRPGPCDIARGSEDRERGGERLGCTDDAGKQDDDPGIREIPEGRNADAAEILAADGGVGDDRVREDGRDPGLRSAIGRSEVYFRKSEEEIRAPETYCPWGWTCPHLSSNLPGRRLLDFVEVVSKQPFVPVRDIACSPGNSERAEKIMLAEIDALSEWISNQPWGHIGGDRKRGLSDGEARPVVQLLHSVRCTVDHFIGYTRLYGRTISADRENSRIRSITAVLISLVQEMPAFRRAYSARERADERSTDPPGKRGS